MPSTTRARPTRQSCREDRPTGPARPSNSGRKAIARIPGSGASTTHARNKLSISSADAGNGIQRHTGGPRTSIDPAISAERRRPLTKQKTEYRGQRALNPYKRHGQRMPCGRILRVVATKTHFELETPPWNRLHSIGL